MALREISEDKVAEKINNLKTKLAFGLLQSLKRMIMEIIHKIS